MKRQLHREENWIFPFISYTPETKGEKLPLVLQLHGAGERGSGQENLDLVEVWGFPELVQKGEYPCMFVFPQCPLETFWAARVESILRFIDQLVEEYDIDTDRIYLTGLSMGGFGTWYTAMAYPDLFAAIAPCCGGGMAWNAHTLKMPVWAFHGLEDTVVSPNQTIEMVEALKNSNPYLKYDLYEGVGHGSWIPAFCEETLRWILTHKKAE